MPVALEPAEPPVGAVERNEREPDDHGGEGQRQVDEGVEEAPPGHVAAHDEQRADDPEDRVHDDGDRRDLERQLEGGDRVRRGDRGPRAVEVLGRAPHHHRERRDEDERQVAERDDAEAMPTHARAS